MVDHYVLVLNTYLECGFGRFLGRRGTSRGDDEEGRERYASHRGRRTVTGENKMRGTRERECSERDVIVRVCDEPPCLNVRSLPGPDTWQSLLPRHSTLFHLPRHACIPDTSLITGVYFSDVLTSPHGVNT